MIDRKKYKKRLNNIRRNSCDIEMDHEKADEVLCDLLKELGYSDIVSLWNRIPKWYA